MVYISPRREALVLTVFVVEAFCETLEYLEFLESETTVLESVPVKELPLVLHSHSAMMSRCLDWKR